MNLQYIEILIHSSKYFLVFIGAFLEGPVVTLSSGFLLSLQQFTFWPLYMAIILGDFIGDIFWYLVGRFGARKFINRFGHLFKIDNKKITQAEKLFYHHQDKILFLSKVTMGFGSAIAVLITAGMLHVSFKRYVLLNFLGGFIWTGTLIFIGFHFGNIYDQIPIYLKYPFLILFVLIVFFSVKYFKKINLEKILKKADKSEKDQSVV
ncbi:MAG: DedA family protein [Candidatus Pacebacteria bacterium]|nr:DedA family protein [Candidatus Paceibacterota bacterium]MCF7863067.1 DedA family protein [Candidatus Paceibacterota bacterium]